MSGEDMRIEVVTLFPEFVGQAVRVGVLGRAIEAGRVAVNATTPREFATDVHRTVDDRPYGGGPGMVLKIEPARTAIRAAKARLPAGSRSVYLAADGAPLTHALAREFAQLPGAGAGDPPPQAASRSRMGRARMEGFCAGLMEPPYPFGVNALFRRCYDTVNSGGGHAAAGARGPT